MHPYSRRMENTAHSLFIWLLSASMYTLRPPPPPPPPPALEHYIFLNTAAALTSILSDYMCARGSVLCFMLFANWKSKCPILNIKSVENLIKVFIKFFSYALAERRELQAQHICSTTTNIHILNVMNRYTQKHIHCKLSEDYVKSLWIFWYHSIDTSLHPMKIAYYSIASSHRIN